MKIYIMTDLEGVAGVVDFKSQAYSDGKYFEKAKELLTEEYRRKNIDQTRFGGPGPGKKEEKK